MQSILPDISFEEALELTKIYSVFGKLKNGEIINKRPFRMPHHTISTAGMLGGGKKPKIGEITLAHLGVLYLDELAEFKKDTLEALREPLEDKKITITRTNYILEYPSNFMLLASMNPCPCGFFGSKKKECTCTEAQRKKYFHKISGPFLDRIDLKVEVLDVEYKKISESEEYIREKSIDIRRRVVKAKQIQIERYKNENIISNSELTPDLVKRFCNIDSESSRLLEQAYYKFNLSVRGYNKILKIARTIADLDGENNIKSKHIAEAIQYRCGRE